MKILSINSFHRTILRMALPAIAGLSTQMVVSVVDAAMIGRLKNAEYALAAMGISVLATWAIVSFFSSLSTGTHVLVARRYGEKDFASCSKVLFNSIVIAFSTGLFIALLGMFFAPAFIQLFAKDTRVGELAGQFMVYRLVGLPFFLITVSFRGFYFGIGNTRVFMVSGIIINLLNIVFNYILIYGAFGLPAMGVAGSGFGSSLATICDSFYYLVVACQIRYIQKFHFIKNAKVIPDIIRSIIRLSIPVSFQNVFILIGFLSFVAITGLIGTKQQAATQVVISTLFISFLPCMGFGIAVQTLVGNNVGKGKRILARLYGIETAKIATIYTLILSCIYVFIPQYLLWIITEQKDIIRTAVPVMRIAGFAQIFYGIGIVLANGLQAVGKTGFVMFAEVFSNLFLLVPVSYFLGVYLHYGLTGAWLAMPVYILIYSCIIVTKFSFGEWKTLKKI